MPNGGAPGAPKTPTKPKQPEGAPLPTSAGGTHEPSKQSPSNTASPATPFPKPDAPLVPGESSAKGKPRPVAGRVTEQAPPSHATTVPAPVAPVKGWPPPPQGIALEAGTDWKPIELPAGTKLYAAGPPGKDKFFWGASRETDLLAYVRGGQWAPKWGHDKDEPITRTPIVEYEITTDKPLRVWASKFQDQPVHSPLPHLGARKIQYWNPEGLGVGVGMGTLGYTPPPSDISSSSLQPSGGPARPQSGVVGSGGGLTSAPILKHLSVEKQEAHTFWGHEVHKNPGKSKVQSTQSNRRIERLTSDVTKDKDLHISLFNKQYSDPAIRPKVQALAQERINAGAYTKLSKGGYQIKMDMGEYVGWQNKEPTQIIEVRVSEKGIWHFFPSQSTPRLPQRGAALTPAPTGPTLTQGPTGAKSPRQGIQSVSGNPLGHVQGRTAGMNAATLALQLSGTLLNYYGDLKQQGLANEALQPLLPSIAQEIANHPDKGVLLVYNYEQVKAGQDSVIQPSPKFLLQPPRVAYGRTREEAISNLPDSLSPAQTGNPDGFRPVGDIVWHPPQQVNPANFAPPFPEIAVARFRPGHEELQQIKWINGGLKHNGSTSLPSPAKWDWAPSFYVLETPKSLDWVEPGHRSGTTPIALDTKATANGFSVATAGGAIPVFAFDENTFNLFQAAKDLKTGDNNGELNHYTNIGLVRWVSPNDIEIVRVLSHEGIGATIPAIETSEVEKELANSPAQVRALWEGLTHKGEATTAGTVLERFLALVPSDLTAHEVELLTARQSKAESVDAFLDSLEKSIQQLPSRAGGQGGTAAGGGLDFQKTSVPGYTAPAISEQIQVLLGGVDWSKMQKGPTPFGFDSVMEKEGKTVQTFAYGIDDQGRKWGALVTVAVAKNDGGFIPVTVSSSTVLVSEQAEVLYGNSVLLGRTFRLKPEQDSVRP